MQYLIASRAAAELLPPGCRIVADGEMASFELPWPITPLVVARMENAVDLGSLANRLSGAGLDGFAVEGVADPGVGEALLVGGHLMRDAQAFQPYAAAVPETVKAYGGRFLARGGKVTVLAGTFAPERVVLSEYPTVDAAVSWYTSEAYAPMLKIRLVATEARLVIMARSGRLDDRAKSAAAKASATAAGLYRAG